MSNSSELIEKAITEAKSGNRTGAKKLLAQVVRKEPSNAQAWYLLSRLVEEKEQIIYCLKKVLEIMPDNSQAKARLKKLQSESTPKPSIPIQTIKKGGANKRIVIVLTVILGFCIILLGVCYGINALGLLTRLTPTENLPQFLTLTESNIIPAVIFTDTPEIKPTNIIIPTDTPFPTSTLPMQTEEPSAVPTEIPPAGSGENLDAVKFIAKNYIGSVESNGVIVELSRVIIGDKETLAKKKDIAYLTDPDYEISEVLKNSTIVVEIIFKITNNTDKILNLSLSSNDAVFILNGVQIPLQEYTHYSNLQDSYIDGNIFPNSSVNGGFWLPTSLLSVNEAKSVVLGLPPAYDEDYHDVTDSFSISADIVDWGWEDIPQEFKQ